MVKVDPKDVAVCYFEQPVALLDMPSDRARNHASLVGADVAKVSSDGEFVASVPIGHVARAEVTTYVQPEESSFFRVQYEIYFDRCHLQMMSPIELFRK